MFDMCGELEAVRVRDGASPFKSARWAGGGAVRGDGWIGRLSPAGLTVL